MINLGFHVYIDIYIYTEQPKHCDHLPIMRWPTIDCKTTENCCAWMPQILGQ